MTAGREHWRSRPEPQGSNPESQDSKSEPHGSITESQDSKFRISGFTIRTSGFKFRVSWLNKISNLRIRSRTSGFKSRVPGLKISNLRIYNPNLMVQIPSLVTQNFESPDSQSEPQGSQTFQMPNLGVQSQISGFVDSYCFLKNTDFKMICF